MATLYMRAGMYTEAVAACDRLLTELREQCRVPDRALFQKATVLQFGLRQNAEAITAYERLLMDFPSSVFAGESRKRIRQLRGDVL
jgi:tetratricopeptide (TPR) repeat protein